MTTIMSDKPYRPNVSNWKTHNVAAEQADPNSLMAWYRSLISLRNVMPEKTKDTARRVIAKVVAELMERLERKTAEALRGAVDDHADVKLLADVGALLDQQPPHLLAARAGLVGDELHAEDLARALLDFFEGLRDLHAAALAAAAGVDLRLDDPHRSAERLRCAHRLVDAERGDAARHGHAEFAEQFLALVFVDLHLVSSAGSVTAGAPLRCHLG